MSRIEPRWLTEGRDSQHRKRVLIPQKCLGQIYRSETDERYFRLVILAISSWCCIIGQYREWGAVVKWGHISGHSAASLNLFKVEEPLKINLRSPETQINKNIWLDLQLMVYWHGGVYRAPFYSQGAQAPCGAFCKMPTIPQTLFTSQGVDQAF